ncbi:hypothetical protein ES319_A08G092200v1 [Gossypium barbadense]|uniref:Uncharacterized protein n=2 Tax=Gossypium TaxID=3633 RepID=A0A5J5UMX6_GOSBA|nr:hypothetical protein ES319_A08G092200v1 [Gossypium barbadense]KAB2069377.1 hypothetical protein ES319_A08G092200v1 [Gossypium barbadense]TYH05662.1 hypothetical protein ES288_A08G099900v1 [Gossypium darwinii]TYH05663.1 hypothetical protein ES288_A08G099900v1 [Gossypium darwinii]
MQRNQNAIKKLKTSFFFSRTSNFSLIFSVRLSRPFVFHRLSCVARNIVFQQQFPFPIWNSPQQRPRQN